MILIATSIFCVIVHGQTTIPDQPLRGIFCWDLDQEVQCLKTSWVLGLQKTRISGIIQCHWGIKIDALMYAQFEGLPIVDEVWVGFMWVFPKIVVPPNHPFK